MREYEITYLISDDLNESEITKATGKVSGLIAEHKGKVLKEETWGRRKLAYPIKKQTFATYITTNFEMEGAEIKPFEKELFLTKEIIRHLLILREFGKEKLELTAEDIAKTSDIEEVVGGEKSFEAIEGQTEDSYELMSKREGKEEESAETEKTGSDTNEEKEEILEPVRDDTNEEKPKAEKPAKAKAEKAEVTEKEEIEEKKEEPKAKKTAVKKKAKKDENAEDEADRLAKLNQEIEDILGDDL